MQKILLLFKTSRKRQNAASYSMSKEVLSPGKSCRGVRLTVHLHQVTLWHIQEEYEYLHFLSPVLNL
jgi:hypothetical protein